MGCVELALRKHPVTGLQVEVPCRWCWACRKARVDDWTGRCFAESLSAAGVSILTLTYGTDCPGSVLLLMADVQRLWKRLRKAGHKLRYIVAGEHGSRHGRAHWHCVVFWQSAPPELPRSKTFSEWKFWPHGHVYSDAFSLASLRYVLKYLLKDEYSSMQVSRLAMSKKPPLGYRFLIERVDSFVDRKIELRDLSYQVPGAVGRDGKRLTFWLQGRMAEKVLDRYQLAWRLRWGDPPPHSEWMTETYLNAIARKELEDAAIKASVENWQAVTGEVGNAASALDPDPGASDEDLHPGGDCRLAEGGAGCVPGSYWWQDERF